VAVPHLRSAEWQVSGDSAKNTRTEGNCVSNTYQKNRCRAHAGPLPGVVAVSEQVVVSMTEIAATAKEDRASSANRYQECHITAVLPRSSTTPPRLGH